MSRSISPDGKKTPVTLIVGLPRKLNRMPLAGGGDNVNLQSFFAKLRERWSGEFPRPAAASGGVDDGKEAIRMRRERIQVANSYSTKISCTNFTETESRLRCPDLPDAPPEHFF